MSSADSNRCSQKRQEFLEIREIQAKLTLGSTASGCIGEAQGKLDIRENFLSGRVVKHWPVLALVSHVIPPEQRPKRFLWFKLLKRPQGLISFFWAGQRFPVLWKCTETKNSWNLIETNLKWLKKIRRKDIKITIIN